MSGNHTKPGSSWKVGTETLGVLDVNVKEHCGIVWNAMESPANFRVNRLFRGSGFPERYR